MTIACFETICKSKHLRLIQKGQGSSASAMIKRLGMGHGRTMWFAQRCVETPTFVGTTNARLFVGYDIVQPMTKWPLAAGCRVLKWRSGSQCPADDIAVCR